MIRPLIALLLASACALAGQPWVSLAWDASPDEVLGYRLHYGFAPGEVVASINVGDVLTYRIEDLTDGETYYFTVTAYNAFGESDSSNELEVFVKIPGAPQNLRPAPPFVEFQASLDLEGWSTVATVPIEEELASSQFWRIAIVVND